jgi:hypothetical protein
VDGQPIRFHRHQAQAIAKAAQRHSFARTGSGKSLCLSSMPRSVRAQRPDNAGDVVEDRLHVKLRGETKRLAFRPRFPTAGLRAPPALDHQAACVLWIGMRKSHMRKPDHERRPGG